VSKHVRTSFSFRPANHNNEPPSHNDTRYITGSSLNWCFMRWHIPRYSIPSLFPGIHAAHRYHPPIFAHHQKNPYLDTNIQKNKNKKYGERPWRMNCKHVHIMWNQYQIILCTLCDSIKFLTRYIETLYPTEHQQQTKNTCSTEPPYQLSPSIPTASPSRSSLCKRKRWMEKFSTHTHHFPCSYYRHQAAAYRMWIKYLNFSFVSLMITSFYSIYEGKKRVQQFSCWKQCILRAIGPFKHARLIATVHT
jgi:hypothetical protein